jgi:hypothetical protein
LNPDHHASPATDARHRAFSAFSASSNHEFRIYLVSGTAAMMADSIEHVISYRVIVQKVHSPALGGLAALSRIASMSAA